MRARPVRLAAPPQPAPEIQALRASVEATCLRGLADAVGALLGDDPEAVCATLARRRRLGRPDLPWLPGRCWSALAPLGVTPLPQPHAAVLGRALLGAETEPERLASAAQACRNRGDRQPVAALPPAGEIAQELWRRLLLSAVEDFWARLAAVYKRAQPGLREGRWEQLEAALASAEQQLEPTAGQVAVAARRLAGLDDEPRRTPATAGASTTDGTVPARGARDHPLLPVAFLALAVAAAVMVLYGVASGRLAWP